MNLLASCALSLRQKHREGNVSSLFLCLACVRACVLEHIYLLFDMMHILDFLTALLVEGAKINPCVQFAMFNCQCGPGHLPSVYQVCSKKVLTLAFSL